MMCAEKKNDVCAYLGGIIRELNGVALIVNGTADHMHMLVRVPPPRSISEIARVLKTNSSRWIYERWSEHKDFAWQTGYGAFSVSTSNIAAVTKYIAEQEEHHKTRSFQDEFIAFLRKNGIVYDDRHIGN
ncbi:MAG TPA: transposase [Terriglobales bacterium]|nr:transposase [Terriglobales bacterium]